MEVLLGKTVEELKEVASSCGLKPFVGKQLADWLYRKRVCTFDEMTNISAAGRKQLSERYIIGRTLPITERVSIDGTRKYLFEVKTRRKSIDEGRESEAESKGYAETVYIPIDDRVTLCISTQSGCRMGCRFCMTGTLGFLGHLSAADILNQIFYFARCGQSPIVENVSERSGQKEAALPLTPITNIVVMGEGEPMDNIDAVLRALNIITSEYGWGWSPTRITVSTVGAGEGLERFLKESDCNLAISLHSPISEERAKIMPAEKLRPMREVLDMVSKYDFRHQRRLSFEYILWNGLNDSVQHAKELVKLVRPFAPQCRVNLIRFHEGADDSFPATDERRMQAFSDYLNGQGIVATIRRSRGQDISAACGMLVNEVK